MTEPTDQEALELTEACAKAMGKVVHLSIDHPKRWEIRYANGTRTIYQPLTDDAQAAELDQLLVENGTLMFSPTACLYKTRHGAPINMMMDGIKSEHRRRAKVMLVAGMAKGLGLIAGIRAHVKEMAAQPGVYVCGSTIHPDIRIPILSTNGKLYSVERDRELPLEGFTEDFVKLHGPL